MGDPQQLRATVFSRSASEAGLGRALFERLKSTFERWGCARMLNQQYRMHAEICEFPSAHFYGGELFTAEAVKKRADPAWYTGPIFSHVRRRGEEKANEEEEEGSRREEEERRGRKEQG